EHAPIVELRQGKHVLCFMSLTCSHCRDAAKKIHEISEENKEIPFYFIFPKAENDSIQLIAYKNFMEDTHDQGIPHTFIDNELFMDFLRSAGEDGVPAIFWMQDTS